MSTLPAEIGAYEAKTHLSELLRQVQDGRRFTITQRGRPVAELVPAGTGTQVPAAEATDRMRHFMRMQTPIPGIDIKALASEGRD